ncbi:MULTISPECIES: hypothetical protein [unclassified Pedobacter]|uniref:hypothetical protein n=1 Tax=unclassified Pedobacter TaxID=2628915 RepID=UPI001422B0D7|nr:MULTISPECIES: hypothetical protein [unclassified Pedobacter]NII81758.1 hypothetical protein [Pedobacter sp. SG908]NMN35760.1 hypothetical protein [Pedobacter sp. SG918]
MKKILLIIIITFSLASCKKDNKPTLLGTWLSSDKGTQFTIDNLEGKGKESFILKGDTLIWTTDFMGETKYKVVYIHEQTITLSEKGNDIQFIRIR